MAEVTNEAVRREQSLEVERIRLAARKAARMSEIDPAAALAWKRLGVTDHAITQVRKSLSDLVQVVLTETKGQLLPAALLANLTTVKDSMYDTPTKALPSATRELLLATVSRKTAVTVCDLYDAGFEVLPADMVPPVRCLAAEEPRLADVAVLQTRWGTEWRLFADVALVNIGYAPLDPEQLTNMLWKPTGLVDPTRSGLHRWVAFLHAYELTLSRDLDAAWEQLELFRTNPAPMTPIEEEVVNLRAYLMLLKSGDDRLDDVIVLLDAIRRSPTAQGNCALLRARRATTRNERRPIENPYLALGVAHGAPTATWRLAWKAIRSAKRDDLDAMSAANGVRDQIFELEKDGSDGHGRVYVTPLDKRFTTFINEGGKYGDHHASPKEASRNTTEVIRLAALHEFLMITHKIEG